MFTWFAAFFGLVIRPFNVPRPLHIVFVLCVFIAMIAWVTVFATREGRWWNEFRRYYTPPLSEYGLRTSHFIMKKDNSRLKFKTVVEIVLLVLDGNEPKNQFENELVKFYRQYSRGGS